MRSIVSQTPPGAPALDRRLDPGAAAPIAVAFSGGGDSLAALIATLAWAARHGRRVRALHVDHGLQVASHDWAHRAMATARALGAEGQVLAWEGPRPERGLADAARQARHGLIARAARAAGARVVVMGHTADDAHEAELMRRDGASLGRLAEWRPSPVWPQGHGLFLLRPLLGERRAGLRTWLSGQGYVGWIEDPANDALASPRARARRDLAAAPPSAEPHLAEADLTLAALALRSAVSEAGAISVARAAFVAAPPAVAHRWLAAAMASAGGEERPPRRARVQALAERLGGAAPVIATLAGAQLQAADQILIAREAGAFRRRLSGAGETVALDDGSIWDGRFKFTREALDETMDEASVVPLAGMAQKLPRDQRTRLIMLPPSVRGGLPVLVNPAGEAVCPILAGATLDDVRCLVKQRFLAACDAISKESQI